MTLCVSRMVHCNSVLRLRGIRTELSVLTASAAFKIHRFSTSTRMSSQAIQSNAKKAPLLVLCCLQALACDGVPGLGCGCRHLCLGRFWFGETDLELLRPELYRDDDDDGEDSPLRLQTQKNHSCVTVPTRKARAEIVTKDGVVASS